jgi:hypothetical protein
MFAWLKKKLIPTDEVTPLENQMRTEAAESVEIIKAKWIQFHNTVHLKAEIPLAQKIDFFLEPIHQFYEKKYPLLAAGPAEHFFLTTFTAILESGTHPTAEINAAIAQFRGKYAKGGGET